MVSGSARVALVIPTLGERPELMERALDSIRQQSMPVRVVIVAPPTSEAVADIARRWDATLLADPGGLVVSINAGIDECLSDSGVEFVGWLNDDDLLEPGSMSAVVASLDQDPRSVVAFGACRYIDADGNELFLSKAGKVAPFILPWGPDLIPQPGMLVRATAWREVGGLDPKYRLAFDLDLLLRLSKRGRLRYAGCIVSSFRWHPDSLTVEDRELNLQESQVAKRSALMPVVCAFAPLWELPVRVAIRQAAKRVNSRVRENALKDQH